MSETAWINIPLIDGGHYRIPRAEWDRLRHSLAFQEWLEDEIRAINANILLAQKVKQDDERKRVKGGGS